MTRAGRMAAVVWALGAALVLSGCVSAVSGVAGADDGSEITVTYPPRPAEELPTRSPTPTPIPDPDPIRVSGEGPGTIDIPNPYFPIAEGRDRLTFDGAFSCDGPGAFHVQLLPESSGVYMGGTECGGNGGGYAMPIERSQKVYTVQVTVDQGTTWTFSGQLGPAG